MYAVNLVTGQKSWYAPPAKLTCTPGVGCAAGQSAAIAVIPGAVFSGAVDGHLRAYSTIDGKILWDFDTAKEFQTRNAVKASGGPLDRGGATIVNGTLNIRASVCANSVLPVPVGPIKRMFAF